MEYRQVHMEYVRENRKMHTFISFVAFCALHRHVLALSAPDVDLNYAKQDEWKGICNNGTRQSPIKIETRRVIRKDNLPNLVIENLDKKISATGTNIGFSVEFNFSGKALPTVSGADLDGTYILNNAYFHWPSEHTVDGGYYDLEGHWVFYSSKYSSLDEAYPYEDGLLYLSFFYIVGAEKGLESISILAEATHKVSRKVSAETFIESISLDVPRHHWSFYKYKGSVPTQPCEEVVSWIVMEDPIWITVEQYEKLRIVYNSAGHQVPFTNRKTQPLNGREVYYKRQRKLI